MAFFLSPQAHVAGGMAGPHHSAGHGLPPVMLHYVSPQQGGGSNPQHGPQQGAPQHFYIGHPQGKKSPPEPEQFVLLFWNVLQRLVIMMICWGEIVRIFLFIYFYTFIFLTLLTYFTVIFLTFLNKLNDFLNTLLL